jgi:hypothetical protein
MVMTPAKGPAVADSAVTLEWLSVQDAACYHAQFSEDKEFQRLLLDKSDLTALSCKVGRLAQQSYFFRIRSIAKDGYSGAWSDPLVVTPSLIPQSVEPAENDDSEIVLRSKNRGEGISYHFQLAKDEQFQTVLVDSTVPVPELKAQKPSQAGNYFVRVATVDKKGAAGAFSAPQVLTIKKGFPYEWMAIGGVGGMILLMILLSL